MTVSTDELTLGDLIKDETSAMTVDEPTQVTPLCRPREVIPMHVVIIANSADDDD